MIDMHTHHERCGHAVGSLEDVARWAYARGIRTFGWSDHAPMFAHAGDHPLPDTQMARSQWCGYLAEAVATRDRLQGQLRDFDIRIGVEADFLPGTEDVYRAALEQPMLDYVLGSVHEVDGRHIYKPGTWGANLDVDAFHDGYWTRVREAAESRLFDVLAHLDAVRAKVPPPWEPPTQRMMEAVECIADCGVAVEINGSGLRRTGETFPAFGLLGELVKRDVPITFGSDAHRPEQLGMGYGAAVASLAALGRQELVTFRERRATPISLEDALSPLGLR